EWLTPLMKGFTLLGNTEAWGLHAILLLVVFERNVGTRWALLLLTAALLASLVGQLLKRTCRRPRPSVALGDTDFVALRDDPDAFSFPSGHTCAAFAVAAALADEGFAIGATE